VIVVAGDLRSAKRGAIDAAAIAGRVAALGEWVEAVGILPVDEVGDRRLLELRALGVGHAAVLRSAAEALDAADLDLALRYLPDISAVVLVEVTPGLVATAAAAASWLGAGLVIVARNAVELAGEAPGPDRTIVLGPPRSDPDGVFAGLVAAVAVRLAAGSSSVDALTLASTALGVERVSGPISEEPLP
jgi:hypothetical protein